MAIVDVGVDPSTPPGTAGEDGAAALGGEGAARARWLAKYGLGFLTIAVIVGAYWLYTLQPQANATLTPSPPKVVRALWTAIADGSLFVNIGWSLYRVVVGFALGALLAVLLGCTAGWFRTAGYVLNPIIEAIRPIPARCACR